MTLCSLGCNIILALIADENVDDFNATLLYDATKFNGLFRHCSKALAEVEFEVRVCVQTC